MSPAASAERQPASADPPQPRGPTAPAQDELDQEQQQRDQHQYELCANLVYIHMLDAFTVNTVLMFVLQMVACVILYTTHDAMKGHLYRTKLSVERAQQASEAERHKAVAHKVAFRRLLDSVFDGFCYCDDAGTICLSTPHMDQILLGPGAARGDALRGSKLADFVKGGVERERAAQFLSEIAACDTVRRINLSMVRQSKQAFEGEGVQECGDQSLEATVSAMLLPSASGDETAGRPTFIVGFQVCRADPLEVETACTDVESVFSELAVGHDDETSLPPHDDASHHNDETASQAVALPAACDEETEKFWRQHLAAPGETMRSTEVAVAEQAAKEARGKAGDRFHVLCAHRRRCGGAELSSVPIAVEDVSVEPMPTPRGSRGPSQPRPPRSVASMASTATWASSAPLSRAASETSHSTEVLLGYPAMDRNLLTPGGGGAVRGWRTARLNMLTAGQKATLRSVGSLFHDQESCVPCQMQVKWYEHATANPCKNGQLCHRCHEPHSLKELRAIQRKMKKTRFAPQCSLAFP